jgi:thiamine-phosphate pyrophosphorylase
MVPKLYAIVDAKYFSGITELLQFTRDLIAGGVTLLQYRDKKSNARQVLSCARELRRVLENTKLIMNDRADLCLAAGFDGVHLGQDDLSVEGARRILGNELWVGMSTHAPEQIKFADATSATYIAIGPVFQTASKEAPDPVVGLEGVRLARQLTRKPLVAIGGITRANCGSVIRAGADSVAVISDLRGSPRNSAEEFLQQMG